MSETWTIGELAEHAARLLRDGAPPPANGRVRDVPGERLIRWYTTIGLVDPPLTRRGRIARYGRRHLLQLVAVKRLQAAGRSIAEIQAALAGATDRMLETAARVEATPVTDAGQAGGAASGRAGGGGPGSRVGSLDGETARGRFWAERPGAVRGRPADAGGGPGGGVAPAQAGGGETGGAGVSPHSGQAGRGTTASAKSGAGHGGVASRASVVSGVRLGDGVRLVLDAGRVPSEEDVQAVLAAAGPLLAVLEERELT